MNDICPKWLYELRFFNTQAKREGLTLEEFLKKYNLEDPRKPPQKNTNTTKRSRQPKS